MAWALLFVLSIIVAMFSNYAGPRFYATSFGQKYSGKYSMRTLTTALVIFAGIVLATVVIDAVSSEKVRLENPIA